jgi:hypothetical protein
MTPDSFAHALEQLDPGSRALLDLSLHRGLDDGEIADLLGSDAEYVSTSRDAAIEQLAADLGMRGDADELREALADMPEGAWRRPAPTRGGHTADVQPAEAQTGDGSGSESNGHAPVADLPHVRVSRPDAGRGTAPRRRLLALVLAGAAAIVLVIVLASSGGGSKSTSTPKAPAPARPAAAAPTSSPSPAPAAKGGAALSALAPSSSAKGTARLRGRRLTLSVSGLAAPAGSYEVWLYNDQIDAVPVTSFRSGSTTVSATLPQSPAGYRYLDVSLEPADGNPNHSGQSVLRVPLRDLR